MSADLLLVRQIVHGELSHECDDGVLTDVGAGPLLGRSVDFSSLRSGHPSITTLELAGFHRHPPIPH